MRTYLFFMQLNVELKFPDAFTLSINIISDDEYELLIRVTFPVFSLNMPKSRHQLMET